MLEAGGGKANVDAAVLERQAVGIGDHDIDALALRKVHADIFAAGGRNGAQRPIDVLRPDIDDQQAFPVSDVGLKKDLPIIQCCVVHTLP